MSQDSDVMAPVFTMIEYPSCNFLFVDLEASSLSMQSYPLEVGWSAWDTGETGSLIIKPEETWPTIDWDPRAEAVHGISRNLVACNGVSASCAARVVLALARHRHLVADQPAWDGGWLRLLLSAIGEAPRQVFDFDVLCWTETARLLAIRPPLGVERSVQQVRLACYSKREQATASWPEVKHRAGPDARRLHAGYAAVHLAVDQCCAEWTA